MNIPDSSPRGGLPTAPTLGDPGGQAMARAVIQRPRLAERLRPRSLDEVIGQRHLLGPGKPLRAAFDAGRLHSMILWGPPGVGKTTLARLVANAFDAEFIQISAVLGGVKDIRDAVERAQAAFRDLTESEMDSLYGRSGRTCRQVLQSHLDERARWQAASDLLNELLATKSRW